MNKALKLRDPVIYSLIAKEFRRQKNGLELIASENFTSKSVFDCLGSIFTNKYSEGQVGNRYYGGCGVVDEVEQLCKDRAFILLIRKEDWVNVLHSGSPQIWLFIQDF